MDELVSVSGYIAMEDGSIYDLSTRKLRKRFETQNSMINRTDTSGLGLITFDFIN